MAKPKREKKPEPAKPAAVRLLPMQLEIGDRLTDETGEYEAIGRPYTTAASKTAHVRVRRVGGTAQTDFADVGRARAPRGEARRRVMGRPTGEKNDYRGWSYRVVVIPTPDNRWTFAVHFERGDDPLRTRHAHGTYVTMQEADARGDAFAREWIDQWGGIF